MHHKVCHVLGGAYNLPHAGIHSAVLPYATAYNRDAAPEAMRRIAAALRADNAALGLWELAAACAGAPPPPARLPLPGGTRLRRTAS